MSWINRKIISSLLITAILLFFSWQMKSFPLMIFCVAIFLLSIAINFPKIRGFLVPFVAVGFTLAVAEFSIPLMLSTNDTLTRFDPNSDYTNGYSQRIEGYGYRPNPGVHSSTKLTSLDEVIYDVAYTIGMDGYRADVDAQKYDAYIYGGSFTFGEGLNDNETLTHFLYKNHEIAAKNLGVHGYGLHQALYNLQNGVTSDKPNGVNIILTAPWHSLRSACKPNYAKGTPRYTLVNNSITLDGVCPGRDFFSRVLGKSNIFKLITLSLVNDKNTITNDDLQLYLEIIREIYRVSQDNGAAFVIAYIDAKEERLVGTRWTNESLFNQMKLISDVVVDVTLSEQRESLDPQFYIHELDQHPSAKANVLRAELIAKVVEGLHSSE